MVVTSVRVSDLSYDKPTVEPPRVYDATASTHRGRVGGPYSLWLRISAIGEAMDAFRNALRDVDLTPTMHELLTLPVARHYRVADPWSVHAKHTLDAGLLSAVQPAALAAGTSRLISLSTETGGAR